MFEAQCTTFPVDFRRQTVSKAIFGAQDIQTLIHLFHMNELKKVITAQAYFQHVRKLRSSSHNAGISHSRRSLRCHFLAPTHKHKKTLDVPTLAYQSPWFFTAAEVITTVVAPLADVVGFGFAVLLVFRLLGGVWTTASRELVVNSWVVDNDDLVALGFLMVSVEVLDAGLHDYC